MLILITKDSATVVPREVSGVEEALMYQSERGFVVLVEAPGGGRIPLDQHPDVIAFREAAEGKGEALILDAADGAALTSAPPA